MVCLNPYLIFSFPFIYFLSFDFSFSFISWTMKRHITSLLFLLPPSCMVAPIGKFANKFSFSSHFSKFNMTSNFNTSLPPLSNNSDLGMDIQLGAHPNTNSEE